VAKLIIPIILVITVVVAGVFAFVPIDDASTVHFQVMANTQRIDTIICEDGDDPVLNPCDTGSDGEDLVITCPETSDGCRILEIYFDENDAGAGTIDLESLTGSINGIDYTIQADLGTLIDGTAEAVAGLSGVTFGGGDTITIEITGASESYNTVIFIQTEGNTVAEAEFTNP